MKEQAYTDVYLPEAKLFKRGKVRDVFDLDDQLLIVASDRISAFDSIMPNGIPDKGRILTQLSNFWFDYTKIAIDNHLISTNIDNILEKLPKTFLRYRDVLNKRTVLVKKTKLVEAECVVRGYITGSGWNDYQKNGEVNGIKLPAGLREADKLPEPIFTPSTKASSGHDLPVTEAQLKDMIGSELAELLKAKSLDIYKRAAEFALKKGVIIADTKFEFGELDGKIILIDEILTPDSSRFWPTDTYKPGKSQFSYDKQFVRDYLLSINWDKEPPAPKLSDEVVEKTKHKYMEAYRRITGKELL